MKGPDARFLGGVWEAHPYQYVDQNPVVFWEPDGTTGEKTGKADPPQVELEPVYELPESPAWKSFLNARAMSNDETEPWSARAGAFWLALAVLPYTATAQVGRAVVDTPNRAYMLAAASGQHLARAVEFLKLAV